MCPKDGLRAAKAALRLTIRKVLNDMSPEDCAVQSSKIHKQLVTSEEYSRARSVAFYLSMPQEVCTQESVLHALRAGKSCFVPICRAGAMRVLKLRDEEDLLGLPANSWGIREPLPVEGREDPMDTGGVDLVIVPGVAYTPHGVRLGHGKGYYDRFLGDLRALRQELKKPVPSTLGLAFQQQIQESVPSDEGDYLVDRVIYPDEETKTL